MELVSRHLIGNLESVFFMEDGERTFRFMNSRLSEGFHGGC